MYMSFLRERSRNRHESMGPYNHRRVVEPTNTLVIERCSAIEPKLKLDRISERYYVLLAIVLCSNDV